MDVIYERFAENIRSEALIADGERVLAALSGGADSVFMLRMLCRYRQEHGTDVAAFHLNHNMRAEAAADAAFCEHLCAELGVKLYVFSRDINAIAAREHLSPEDAGRRERYEIMNGLRGEFQKAATAHHADDNAETVLMHLIRGAGVDGLCGIPPVRDGWIIRPLLCFTKAEIVGWLDENGCRYVVDKSNFSGDYFRNRVRGEIIPLIQAENPRFSKAAARLSASARLYRGEAEASAEKVKLTVHNGRCRVSHADAAALGPAALFSLLKRMTHQFAGENSDMTYETAAAIAALVGRKENTVWSYDAAHIVFARSYGMLEAYPRADGAAAVSFCAALKVPSAVLFCGAGFFLRIFSVDREGKKNIKNKANRYITAIDYDKINDSLTVRSRRRGDKFMQIGLGDFKSVKRLFIDRKIPASRRDQIPIVCCGNDIVCICGLETDERFKISDSTERFLIIQYNYAGELL